jgi:hypothetical protein
VVEFLPQTQL